MMCGRGIFAAVLLVAAGSSGGQTLEDLPALKQLFDDMHTSAPTTVGFFMAQESNQGGAGSSCDLYSAQDVQAQIVHHVESVLSHDRYNRPKVQQALKLFPVWLGERDYRLCTSESSRDNLATSISKFVSTVSSRTLIFEISGND